MSGLRCILMGHPASGKTTVGQLLAVKLGAQFIDLDDEIAERTGHAVADLVTRDLQHFRQLEAQALRELLQQASGAGHDVVLAVGGGTPTFETNLASMKAAAMVVCLTAALPTAVARAPQGSRPLMANPTAAQALWRERAEIYRQAHAQIATDAKSPAEVANEVAALLSASARFVDLPGGPNVEVAYVALADRSYPVVVHQRLADLCLANFLPTSRTGVAVVVDANLANYVPALCQGLSPLTVIAVPAGEASKSFATYQRLCNELLAAGCDRSTTIVAIGGGVVGDLAGFVAATLFRGLAVVHVPTSLVAMVDSSIGGKTAIDTDAGKNLVGAFWQPYAVVTATELLATLPARERIAGFGELWKYALLSGPALWRQLLACAQWGKQGGVIPDELAAAIAASIRFKAAIVGADERELTGTRALLNLGHTVGHAIESQASYTLAHGEAVALGLVAALQVSIAQVGASPALLDELLAALQATGLPHDLEPWLTPAVAKRLRFDKKRAGSTLRYIVVHGLGDCAPCPISTAELTGILRFRDDS